MTSFDNMQRSKRDRGTRSQKEDKRQNGRQKDNPKRHPKARFMALQIWKCLRNLHVIICRFVKMEWIYIIKSPLYPFPP